MTVAFRACVPNLLAKAHIYAKRSGRGRPMWDIQGRIVSIPYGNREFEQPSCWALGLELNKKMG